jgi:hypothetical protein
LENLDRLDRSHGTGRPELDPGGPV